ncbi:hypothetical protein [Sandarakinorhabdus sp.]|uniref:hypothetical protein n=1 Tax=Sandarakinorhabdus sp. TaxID=1916663 RepID=UPI00333FF28F
MQMQPEFVCGGQAHCALPAGSCAILAGPPQSAKPVGICGMPLLQRNNLAVGKIDKSIAHDGAATD